MADLSQTASAVLQDANAQTRVCTAGESVTAGDALYLKSSDNKVYLADSNSGSDAAAEIRTFFGYALDTAGAGQPVVVQLTGDINIGATLGVALAYILSSNPGKTAPIADLPSGGTLDIIGYGITTSILRLTGINSGVAKA